MTEKKSSFCWSIDGETWHVDAAGAVLTKDYDGPFETSDAAFASARASYPDAIKISVGECNWENAARFFRADDLIESVHDHASSEVEDADGWPSVSDDAERELQGLLDAWVAKHVYAPNWYEVSDEVKYELVGGRWIDSSNPTADHPICDEPAMLGELGLFQVNDGADHWVIARNREDALTVVVETHYSEEPPEWRRERPEVVHLTVGAAAAIPFIEDWVQESTTTNMLAAAQKNPTRRYVACSEY